MKIYSYNDGTKAVPFSDYLGVQPQRHNTTWTDGRFSVVKNVVGSTREIYLSLPDSILTTTIDGSAIHMTPSEWNLNTASQTMSNGGGFVTAVTNGQLWRLGKSRSSDNDKRFYSLEGYSEGSPDATRVSEISWVDVQLAGSTSQDPCTRSSSVGMCPISLTTNSEGHLIVLSQWGGTGNNATLQIYSATEMECSVCKPGYFGRGCAKKIRSGCKCQTAFCDTGGLNDGCNCLEKTASVAPKCQDPGWLGMAMENPTYFVNTGIAGSALLLSTISYYAHREGRHIVIMWSAIGVADVFTDVSLSVNLYGGVYKTYFILFTSAMGLSLFANAYLLYRIFKEKIEYALDEDDEMESLTRQDREFRQWYVNNFGCFKYTLFLACFDINMIRVIDSRLFNCVSTSSRLSIKVKNRLNRDSSLSMLIENIPQLIIQVLVITESFKDGSETTSLHENLYLAISLSAIDMLQCLANLFGLAFIGESRQGVIITSGRRGPDGEWYSTHHVSVSKTDEMFSDSSQRSTQRGAHQNIAKYQNSDNKAGVDEKVEDEANQSFKMHAAIKYRSVE